MNLWALIFSIVVVGVLLCLVHYFTRSTEVDTAQHTLEVVLGAARAVAVQSGIGNLADAISAIQNSGKLDHSESEVMRSVIVLQLSYFNDLIAVIANIALKDGRPPLGALMELAYGTSRYGNWGQYISAILDALQEKEGAGVGTAIWEAQKPFRDALLCSVHSVEDIRLALRRELKERGVVHHGTCQN